MGSSDAAVIIGIVIAAVSLLITIIIEWKHLQSAARFLKQKTIEIWHKLTGFQRPSMNRRRVLITGLIGITGSILGVGGWKLNFTDFINIVGHPLPSGFLENPKSGVLHYVGTCSSHVPKTKNGWPAASSATLSNIHKQKLVHIAGEVAKYQHGEGVESLLIHAIRSSPTSTHLYKYLVGTWGRKKEYNKIYNFLATNIDYLEQLSISAANNSKQFKRYSKAIVELRKQKTRAEYFAQIGKVSSL